MIHSIGRELETKLAAKGWPFKVYDRETSKRTAWTNGIVIERTPDTVTGARSQSRNPKRYYTRNIGAKLTIYAQSTKSGAAEFEHERVADRVVDLSLVALRTIFAERNVGHAFGGGEFVPIEDLAESERRGGAVYVQPFTVERGVADLTWAGSEAAEFTFVADSITNTTEVSIASVPEDDGDPSTPETACGA